MRQVYYAPLVRWEVVDEIILLVEPEHHAETEQLIIGTIDHVVMETVLLHLDPADHDEFLQKVHDSYHDHSVLFWLKSKIHDIDEKLTAAIRQTKASIRSLLE